MYQKLLYFFFELFKFRLLRIFFFSIKAEFCRNHMENHQDGNQAGTTSTEKLSLLAQF